MSIPLCHDIAILREHVAAWRAALRRARPDVRDQAGLVLVHAARAVVHDLVRLGHRPTDPEDLCTLVHAALAAEAGE